MAPKSKEIYYLPIKFGEVSYNRPCVVIYLANNSATVGLLSSAMDLYNEAMDFLIQEGDSGFEMTGLKKKCFIKGSPFVEIPLSCFGNPIGSITGELSKRYDRWIG